MQKERRQIRHMQSQRHMELYAERICLSINFEREVTDSRPSIFSERVPATVLLFELNSALRVTRDAGTNMQTLNGI